MILLQHEVRTARDLSDLELLQELRRRPALRASVLAELTKAELYGEALRQGTLILEQPGSAEPVSSRPDPSLRLLERCRDLIDEARHEWVGGECGETRWTLDRSVTHAEIAQLQHDLDIAIRKNRETP